MIQKSDSYCTADAGGNTASYKGSNVNCRTCNTIAHCLGHEEEHRLATGFEVHARRLSGEQGTITCSTAEDSVCDICAPGYGGPTCEPCPLGKYMGDGSLQCTDYAPGTFTAVEGSTACRGCEAGEHVEGPACVKCEEGKFSTEANQEHCVECEAQTIAAEAGATECVACEAGYYQKNTGRNKCHKCNPLENCDGGITCTNNRNQQCETCASGYYRQKDGKGCKKCTDAEHCLPDMSECTAAGAALGEGGMGIDRDRSTCTKWDPNPGMTPG